MLNIILSPEEIDSVTAYIRTLNKIALEDYVFRGRGVFALTETVIQITRKH